MQAELTTIDWVLSTRIAIAKRRVIMCSVFAISSLTALSQTQAPIRFGLWEGTLVRRTTVSPATAFALRQRGGKIPPSLNERYQVCMDAARWQKAMANMTVKSPSTGCLVLHDEKSPKSLAHSLKCKLPDGTSVTVTADITWDNGTRSHSTVSVAQVYPGIVGQMTVETKNVSHFVTTACGKLGPGESNTLP